MLKRNGGGGLLIAGSIAICPGRMMHGGCRDNGRCKDASVGHGSGFDSEDKPRKTPARW